MEKIKQTLEAANVKLSWRERFSYGAADVYGTLFGNFLSTFILYYYTDILGISAAVAANIFLVCNLVDAFTAISAGPIADKVRTKWGTYRPFCLFGAIPQAIALVLCFTKIQAGEGTKVIWAMATYLLVNVCYAFINTAYSTLCSAMTTNVNERGVLNVFKIGGSATGSLVVSLLALPLVAAIGAGNEARGYQGAAAVMGILSAVMLLIAFIGTKERVVVEKTEKVKVIDSFKMVLKNKPCILMIFLLMFIAWTFNFRFAVVMYYCKYYLGDAGLLTGFNSLVSLVGIPAIIPIPGLYKKLGKKNTMVLVAILMILNGIVFLLAHQNYYMVAFGFILFGVTLNASFSVVWGMIPDTIEYGEWKTGVRAPGAVVSACAFARKIAIAVATWSVGQALSLIHYSAELEVQTAATNTGIYYLNAVPLIIGGILMLIVILPYNLTQEKFESILKEIDARKASSGSQG